VVLLVALFCHGQREKRQRQQTEANASLLEQKERSEKLSVQNKFIATLTHEIKNVVTKYPSYSWSHSIVSNTTILRETRAWNEEVVTELVQAASFLAEMLNNTLDISKLEEGKIVFNKNYEPLRTVVDMALKISNANAAKKEIQLETSYGDSLPMRLEFDKSRLTQVIMNLVGNAVKFTRRRDVARITVTARRVAEMVEVAVRDNGVGFDARYRHKLFRVFERLHYADEFEGTGVGLAIVRRIVERHGGRVSARSELDVGTVITMTLPAAAPGGEEEATEPEAGHG